MEKIYAKLVEVVTWRDGSTEIITYEDLPIMHRSDIELELINGKQVYRERDAEGENFGAVTGLYDVNEHASGTFIGDDTEGQRTSKEE